VTRNISDFAGTGVALVNPWLETNWASDLCRQLSRCGDSFAYSPHFLR